LLHLQLFWRNEILALGETPKTGRKNYWSIGSEADEFYVFLGRSTVDQVAMWLGISA